MPWIIGFIVAIGITTAVVVQNQDEPQPLAANQPTNASAPADDSLSAPSTNSRTNSPVAPTAAVHPVSIPALIELPLTGRDLTLGDVQATTATYTRYHITYTSGDLTISGIMNIPKGEGPFPVLFLNHGHIDREVYTNGRGLKREQDYFARHGFAVLHSDYRCHAQSDCDGSNEFSLRLGYVKDVMNAVEAVKTANDPRLSKTEFGMLGHSMGGGITLNIMVAKPDLVKAFVLYAAVSGDLRDNFERWITRRPEEAQKIVELYQTPATNPVFWNNLSPQRFFDRVAGPAHFFHGTSDASVPIAWSERNVGQLKAAGKSVEFTVYDSQPHEFTARWSDFMNSSALFFQRYLKS